MPQLYSYSRIGCFFTCPLQYAHRYIHKTPSPLPEGVELFMGSRFHEVMEYLYEEAPKAVPSLEAVVDRFDQAWDAGWKVLLSKQKQRGFATPIRISREGEDVLDYYHRTKLFLERYYEKYKPFDQDRTIGIEKRVVFNLDPAGQYRMQGYIDRVAEAPDGTITIHDYKTGGHKHQVGDHDKEDQLSLYQLGLTQEPAFKNSVFRLQWHYVAFDDDVMEARRTPDDLEGLKATYVKKIQAIEKAKDFLPRTSALCGWCEFLPLCKDGQAEAERRKKKKESQAASAPAEKTPVEPAALPAPAVDGAASSEPGPTPEAGPSAANPAPAGEAPKERRVGRPKKKAPEGPSPQLSLFD